MRIAHKWRGGGILSAKIVAAAFAVVALVGVVVPMVHADGRTFNVPGGSGTLKAAVAEAQDGDVYKLAAASYSGDVNDRTVEIKNSITIEGAGKSTTMNVPIKITAPGVTVTLKGFASSPAIEDNFIFIQVAAANVTLNIEDLSLWGIMRGTSGGFKQYNVRGIDLTNAADGSHVILKNSSIEKPGVQYALAVNASNTEVTVDNSTIEGHPTIYYNDGESNTLKIINNSEIDGPSVQYKDTAVMAFDNQTGMKIEVEDSTVSSKQPSVGTRDMQVFKFGDGSDAKIDIKNSDVHYQDKQGVDSKSVVFDFGANAAAGKFEVAVDSASQVRRSIIDSNFQEQESKSLTPEQQSRIASGVSIVGIFDREGNEKIKLYEGGTDIAELKDDQYIKQDGYNFKGWFQNFDGKEYTNEYAKQDDNYPKTNAGQNLNLYAKFAKIVKVQFGEDEPEELEENDTLEKIADIDNKLKKLVNEDQNHKGFVMHGTAEGSKFLHRVSSAAELKAYPITEDVKIEAIHSVSLFVNGQEFEVNVGENATAIGTHTDGAYKGTQEGYEEARLNGKDEERFSRLVYEDSGETFNPESPINTNTKVKTKHYAIVKVGEDTFHVEQGKKISEDKEGQLLAKLQEIKDAPVEYKTFARFEDDKGNEVKIDGEMTTVSEDVDDMTISPKYQVKVAIADKEYIFDEGKKLNELDEKLDEIKGALQKLVDDAGDRNFKGFVISTTGGEIREQIEVSKESASSKFDEILGKKMDSDTTIYAEYNAKITINCPDNGCDGEDKVEFDVETSTTLADYAKDHGSDYDEAKYQKYVDDEHKADRFARFVIADTGEEFGEEQEIEKSMTLTPKYYMIVEIDDDRGDVAGTYKVEQGKTIESLMPLDGKVVDVTEVLRKLQSDIVPTQDEIENNPEAPSMHFEKLVDAEIGKTGDALGAEPIDKDMKIMGLYHYDVIIVENYDEPNADLGDVDQGRYGFKVYKDESLNVNGDAKTALGKLVESANNTDQKRRFVKFLETNADIEYDETTLLDKVFNRHVYINAIVEYKVTVEGDDTEIYVVDGQELSSNPLIAAELDDLEAVPGKHLTKFTLDGVEMDRKTLLRSKIDGKAVEIGANYEVKITINGQTFTIPAGHTLADLPDQKQEIENALKALRETIEAQQLKFEGYSAGAKIDDVMKATFETDTTIVGQSSITVTIDNDEFEDVKTGETLLNSEKIGEEKLSAHKTKKCGDKDFSRFVLKESDETFTEEMQFTKNTDLTTVCAVKVTMDGDDSYRLEDGKQLDSNEKIMAKIQEYKNNPDKKFHHLEDRDGATIAETDTLSSNTELKPVYFVTVTIEGREFDIKENTQLNTYQPLADLTSYLDVLDSGLADKIFDKYVVDGHKLSREELLERAFPNNATVTATYNVEVSLGGTGTKVTLPLGSTLADSNELQQAIHDFVLAPGKASVAEFVDQNGNTIDDNYKFDVNTVISPKYMVLVKIVGTSYEVDGEEIPDGATVEAAIESMKEVRGNTEKRFKEQFADGWTPSSEITAETTLTPLYEIDVTVEGDVQKYTLDEGKTLDNLETAGWKKPEEFLEFRNEKDERVDSSEQLHKHTYVKAIHNIVVTLPGGTEERIESGKTLSDIPGIETILAGLQVDPKGQGREFARFMDENTGATINPAETKLNQNIKLVPKFYNELTVFRTDDAGEPVEPEHTLKLEEGLPMARMSGEERDKLDQWINKNKEVLAAEGKADYDVKQYLYNSLPVDENATLFDNGERIEAVFAHSPKPVTPPTVDTTEDNETETKPKAPNTGSEVADEQAEGLGAVLVVLVGAILGVGALTVAQKLKQ